jgi:hypothetical protein
MGPDDHHLPDGGLQRHHGLYRIAVKVCCIPGEPDALLVLFEALFMVLMDVHDSNVE